MFGVFLRVAVIGSGPSAFACVTTLLMESQNEVTVFDAGKIGENSSTETVPVDLESEGLFKPGLFFKEDKGIVFSRNGKNINIIPGNQILGGWSNYWGGTLLRNANTNNPALSAVYKSPSWMRLLSMLPNQGEKDCLTERYPLLGNETLHAEVSGISEYLLEHFEGVQSKVDPILFGKSRLAIAALNSDSTIGCISCSKCLDGCKYHHIFNTGRAIEILEKDFGPSRIKIVRDRFISLVSINQKKKIDLIDDLDCVFQDFDFVYIAAGVFGSAALLQRSSLISEVKASETPMTIVPSFLFRKFQKKDTGVSLSEIFMCQTIDGELSSAGQIYSLNEQLLKIVLKKYKISKLKSFIPRYLRSRILLCMFFIPPNNESEFQVTRDKSLSRVEFTGKYRYQMFRKELKKYSRAMFAMGFWTLPVINFPQSKGSSYHYGCLSNTNSTSEKLFRLDGSLTNLPSSVKIFCVDGSSLVKLEPGPITLDLMANAILKTRSSLGVGFG